MAGKANAPNWKKIKTEYLKGGISLRALAEKHGVPFGTLQRKARVEKWADQKREVDDKVETKLIQEIADSQADILAKLSGFQDKAVMAVYQKLLGGIQAFPDNAGTKTIRETVDVKEVKMEDGTVKKFPLRSSFTSDLESAVRTIATLGKLYGLDAASRLDRQRFDAQHGEETPDGGDDAVMDEVRARLETEKVESAERSEAEPASAGAKRQDAGETRDPQSEGAGRR